MLPILKVHNNHDADDGTTNQHTTRTRTNQNKKVAVKNSSCGIARTSYCSYKQGALPEGCKGCVRGEKLVLFITGLCPATCFFCPISDEKKMRDVVFANELALTGSIEKQLSDLFAEARSHAATGAGITGGDPLARLERTCTFIKALKHTFGKAFHIHLYTPLILVNEYTLKQLYMAGLDEIRFHPSLQSDKFWSRMKLAKAYPWSVGMELPVFPDKIDETKKLLAYAAKEGCIDFCNLNELEISERTAEEFLRRGYSVANKSSHAIIGSKEAAFTLMHFAKENKIPTHFCTTKLKDRVQMGNRIKRRAQHTAQVFDMVTDEGLLVRGAIYHRYNPLFGYAKQLRELQSQDKEEELLFLAQIYAWLRRKGMPVGQGMIEVERLRVVLSADALRHVAKSLHKAFPEITCAIVTEYPTSDAFLVQLDEL